jgi:hypothetical protein
MKAFFTSVLLLLSFSTFARKAEDMTLREIFRKGYIVKGTVIHPEGLAPNNQGIINLASQSTCYFTFNMSTKKARHLPVGRQIVFFDYAHDGERETSMIRLKGDDGLVTNLFFKSAHKDLEPKFGEVYRACDPKIVRLEVFQGDGIEETSHSRQSSKD